MVSYSLRAPALGLSLLALAVPASAQFCDTEVAAALPEVSAQFGSSVSIASNVAVVGSPFASGGLGQPGTNGAGSVSVFELIGGQWTLTSTLISPHPEPSGQFGYDVSISGNRMLVGAPFEDSGLQDSGRAYMFENVGGAWVLTDSVTEPVQSPLARFGHSVALGGERVAVSAIRSDYFGPDAGAVYLYRTSAAGLDFEDRVGPNPIAAGGFFGTSIALSESPVGTLCAVGAVYDGSIAHQEGAVYMFARQADTTWDQYAKVVPPVSQSNAYFGVAVDLEGDLLVVGAEGINHGASSGNSGTAFMFRDVASGVLQVEAEVAPPTPIANGNFGRAVSVSGGRMAISELGNGGAVHFYTRLMTTGSPWVHERTVHGIQHTNADSYATDVSLIGDQMLVGASTRSGAVPLAGAAFIYDLEIADCNGNGLNDICEIADGAVADVNGNLVPDSCESVGSSTGCQTIPNSTDAVASLSGIGSNDVLANDIVLIVGDMPLNTFGYPIVSRTPAHVIPPGAVGFRCVGGAVGRDYGNIFNSGPQGSALLPLDLTAIPAPTGALSASSGETWYWQVWHRDSFGGQLTSTFSDSLIVTFQ